MSRKEHQLCPKGKKEKEKKVFSPLTTPLSSPGKALKRSPTCTIPLSTLPETAKPEAVAD
jgi:hypothetical protein